MRQVARLLMLAVALASVLGAGVTMSESGPPADVTRQVSGGGVTVSATLLADRTDATAIRLALSTHSVNLDGYQFGTIALLRDDQGKTYALQGVEGASGSGHHRQAVLRFVRADAGAKTLELIVKDVAGVEERTFRWSVAN